MYLTLLNDAITVLIDMVEAYEDEDMDTQPDCIVQAKRVIEKNGRKIWEENHQ